MAKPKRPKPRRRKRARRAPPGSAPGTLVHDPDAPKPNIHLIGYSAEAVHEMEISKPEEIRAHLGRHSVIWVNVTGLGDASVIERMGAIFGLHPLALEDVLHVQQRPKVEAYGEHTFLVMRMISGQTETVDSEQLSLFVGPGFVLTFQEREGDCLGPVRERIRRGGPRLRHSGPDYLAYAILDAVIDHYFPVLEVLGERLETLEDEVIASPGRDTISRLHRVKRALLHIRRSMWPLRDAVSSLIRDPLPMFTDETRVFLRDCSDHAMRIIDLVETHREVGSDLMSVYLSSVSNRMNEVMKVLTIIATIFIPLTFIAGVYGMNFDPDASPWNMPELEWRYGYPAVMIFMFALAITMLVMFRRRGWLGADPRA